MNLERKISEKALHLVKGQSAEYRSHMEGLPALLRSAGLAQTVAFLKAKGGVQGEIHDHIQAHFRDLNFLGKEAPTLIELVTNARTSTTAQYRLHSQIALRVAFWHKRLAQALIEKKK